MQTLVGKRTVDILYRGVASDKARLDLRRAQIRAYCAWREARLECLAGPFGSDTC